MPRDEGELTADGDEDVEPAELARGVSDDAVDVGARSHVSHEGISLWAVRYVIEATNRGIFLGSHRPVGGYAGTLSTSTASRTG